MAIITKATREAARDAAYSRKLCPCGHLRAQHRELAASTVIENGLLVTRPHPQYRPLHFHCAADGCGPEVGPELGSSPWFSAAIPDVCRPR